MGVSAFRRYLTRVAEYPTQLTWDRLLTLAGLWIAIVLGLLGQGLSPWVGWPLLVLVPAYAVWRKWGSTDLTISHDPEQDQERDENGLLFVYLRVTNESGRSIDDVSVRAVDLQDDGDSELADFVGGRLDVADTGDLPHVPPEKSTSLHSGESAKFYAGRLVPSGFDLTAGWFQLDVKRSRTPRAGWDELRFYKRRPRGRVPAGTYWLTIQAQGHNASGEKATFEVVAMEDERGFTGVNR